MGEPAAVMRAAEAYDADAHAALERALDDSHMLATEAAAETAADETGTDETGTTDAVVATDTFAGPVAEPGEAWGRSERSDDARGSAHDEPGARPYSDSAGAPSWDTVAADRGHRIVVEDHTAIHAAAAS